MEHTRYRLDTVKDELLERDRKMITLQEEVRALKGTIISMKDSAATTMKQTCASALAPTKIRATLSSANVDRSANLIVYELAENDDDIVTTPTN